MTYSLDTFKTQHNQTAASPGGLKRFTHELGLVAGALGLVFWLLALASYSAQDSAWSTSGSALALAAAHTARNWGGKLGAYLADASYFLLGFSVWWLLVAGASGWLASLARWLRAESPDTAAVAVNNRVKFWMGLLLLMMASTGLEWSRLYRFEVRLPDHAGGALGYLVGGAGVKWLGFAGSGLVLIVVGVMAASFVFGFSWRTRPSAWVNGSAI